MVIGGKLRLENALYEIVVAPNAIEIEGEALTRGKS